MKKVLIVDDEKYIRSGLKAMIQKSGIGIDEISECANGREALDCLSKEKYDLVILDIRMPKMDGIELMKEMQKLLYPPAIIILSGYDDFNYAVEAIKYGAKAYLLKPVDRYELFNVLNKVKKEIMQRENIEKKSQRIKKLCLNHLRYIFLSDNLVEQEIREILQDLGIDLFYDPFYISIITSRNNSISNSIDINTLEKFLREKHIKALCLRGPDEELILVTNSRINWEGILKNCIMNSSNQSYIVAVSALGNRLTDIRKAYIQAKEALKYRIFVKGSRVIYYEDILKRTDDYIIPVDKIEKICNMLGIESNKQIEKQLDEVFDISIFYKARIDYFNNFIYMFKHKIDSSLMILNLEKLEEFESKYSNVWNPYYFETIEEYFNFVKSYILELNKYIHNEKFLCENIEYKVDMAIRYIKKHYKEDLNLAVVANHVSLNYYYFSHIFKKITGMSFMDFLLKTRIDKAKELLKNTEDKVKDIAFKVGFKDPKRFAKNFKKITGITPSQYRRCFWEE